MKIKFSTRDILFVVVICALGMGFSLDHRQLQNEIDFLQIKNEQSAQQLAKEQQIVEYCKDEIRRSLQEIEVLKINLAKYEQTSRNPVEKQLDSGPQQ